MHTHNNVHDTLTLKLYYKRLHNKIDFKRNI